MLTLLFLFQRMKNPEYKEESYGYAMALSKLTVQGRIQLAQQMQWFSTISDRQRVLTNASAEQIKTLNTVVANQGETEKKVKVQTN